MKNIDFRPLRADEIDCRVVMCRQNGAQVALYKDARCDMNILDETVGSMNWQRFHSRENANCIVSIWDADKKVWIEKEDVGSECAGSEKEKGIASDSFKRACFNWGVGRELYTSPFIWLDASKVTLKQEGGKWKCNDRLKVQSIKIENKKIVGLTIENQRGVVVYSYNEKAKIQPRMPVQAGAGNVRIEAMRLMFNNNDIDEKKVVELYKLDKLEDATDKQYAHMTKNAERLKKECGM